jgi:membrane protease YdiL (CAAX protease family)
MSQDGRTRSKLLIPALIVALVLPITPLRVVLNALHASTPTIQLVAQIWMWALGAIVLVYILAVERRPLSSVGLGRLSWKSFAWGLGASVVGFVLVGGVLINIVLAKLNLLPHSDALRMLLAMPFWMRLLIVIRAGVVEEFLFRGFGIERLTELTGSRFLASAVTLFSFTMAHISYLSVGQLIVAAGAGLVVTILYLIRRDLWANMISHFLTDALSVLMV